MVQDVLSSQDQNAIVLFGQRRIGKTSILLQLRRRLPSPPFRPVYFVLMDQARKPLGTVLYDLAATLTTEAGLPPPRKEDFTPTGEYFQEKFLPILYQSLGTGFRPIFLLDEFDVLDVTAEEKLDPTAAARTFFPYLRRLMESQPRLAFIFVVGRKVEDLAQEFMAAFKAARHKRISVLDDESARQLIGLAVRDGSLHFTEPAIDRLLSLTAKHPLYLQLMCQLIFDRAYAAAPLDTPAVDVADVDAVIPKTMEAGENFFEWVWGGLPPAERVIFSAVAGATFDKPLITEDELASILQRHGIRILIRELELAPKTLIDWEMLRRADGGYSFFIELMRRWVAERKPLPKVKDELDRVNPIADQQYQLGHTFYRLGQLNEALAPLQAALQVNPNHLKARLLLGEALREQGAVDAAVQQLEEAFRYDPDGARYPLVRALLAQGETVEKVGREDDGLSIYARVLEISPTEQVARDRRQVILVARGDRALQNNDFDGAIAAYRQVGADQKVAAVLGVQRKRAVEALVEEVKLLLKREEWDKAADVFRRLIELNPDDKRYSKGLARVEREQTMARRYAEGLGAMQQRKWAEAQRAFADVIYLRPDYKDVADQLVSANYQLNTERKEIEADLARNDQKRTGASTQQAFTNSIGMEFVIIPAGAFTMGDEGGDIYEKPLHNVNISQSFCLQTTEVSQGQWKKVMGDNPSRFNQCGDDCPVENVSWNYVQGFIEKLNEFEKTKAYRLPTEAEWEYACRARTNTEYSFGDDATKLGEYAWYSGNSESETHSVATRKPNAWGLYDMHGNVWEWVEDDWHESYNGAPDDGSAWIDNPRGSSRVLRGGGWGNHALICRSAKRLGDRPDSRFGIVGFRLSRSAAIIP